MNQQILLLSTIFMFINTHCMEQKELTPVCYLAKMPFKVQNHIAHFWYETHVEFIKRTLKTLKNIMNGNPIHPVFRYCQFLEIDSNTIKHGCWSYSPDETKIAYFNNYYIEKTLTIIDLQKKKADAVLCDTKIDIKYPTEIALSNQATMIAAFEARRHYRNSDLGNGLRYCVDIWSEEHVLEIRKLATNASLEIPFSSHYRCYLTAFNKQGTHVLLYLTPQYQDFNSMSLKMFSLKDKKINLDIPLTDKASVETIIAKKQLSATHTLPDCFISRGICKNIANSINK